MSEPVAGSGRIGYVELLRRNPVYRRLWLGQVVSQLGDWLNSIALYTLLLEYTGSGRAVGGAILCQLLPIFVFGPVAGVLADRLPRKRLLIASDLLRGVVVLGFLFADHPSRYGLVYPLLILQVSLSALFLPTRQAILPSAVSREELAPANALGGFTWSLMLALGAALGGVTASTLGRPAAFLLDSASYFVSAWLLAPLPKFLPPARVAARGFLEWSGIRALAEGLRYVRGRPGLLSVLCVKAAWGLSGGVLLLYSVLGQKIYPLGEAGALSIGLFYAARGLGAALGPIAGRSAFGDRPSALRHSIGIGFLVTGISYVALAYAPNLPVALLLTFASHMGASTLWIASTTLLHHRCNPSFSGRVFAAEQAGVTLTMAASTAWTGHALDAFGATPRALLSLWGVVLLFPALLWWFVQRQSHAWYRGWD